MSSFLVLIALWVVPPEPAARWQVPFFPVSLAALNGQDQLVLVTQSEIYQYDLDGNLNLSIPIAYEPRAVHMDGADQFWLLDDRGIMRCYDPHLELRWQRQMETSVGRLEPKAKLALYATDHFVHQIDPKTGRTRQGAFVGETITAVHLLDRDVVLSPESGRNIVWNPMTRPSFEPHFIDRGAIRFMARSNDHRTAWVLGDKLLVVFNAERKRLWQRRFNTDIDHKPIWFGPPSQPLLAVVTQGRSILVYKRKGLEHTRFNMRDRPTSIVHLNENVFVVTQTAEPEAIWYDSRSDQFSSLPLSAHITHVLSNRSAILLIAYDGQITRFDRRDSEPLADASIPVQ